MPSVPVDIVEMITITRQNLEQLMDDSRFLEALKRAGVDNWEGYSEAVEIYREMIN